MRAIATTIVAVVTLFLCASPGVAQVSASPDEQRVAQHVGQQVRVIDIRGAEFRGTLRQVANGEVHLFNLTHEVRLSFNDVRRLDRRGDSLANGVLIGGLWPLLSYCAGAGQGFNTEGAAVAALPAAILMGGLLGAGIDALNVGWTNVYRADRPRKSVLGIAPTRGGVRVAFTRRF